MKRVGLFATLILAIPFFLYGYTSPGRPQGFVNDFANIISNESETSLSQILTDLRSETSHEVAVVTVPTLDGETVEVYAVKLFEEWGIGQADEDDGVLFLIAPNEREVKIEVGYGLEGTLTDAQSSGIIRNVVIPEFAQENYEEGIIKGTDAIVDVLRSGADYSQNEGSSGLLAAFWNFGFIFFIVLASILGSTKSWWLGGVVGAVAGIIVGLFYGFVFIGIIATVGLSFFGLLLDYILSKGAGKGHRGGPWGGFGGGFGGGSGGGFGGFGGGMSGGGGASGRW